VIECPISYKLIPITIGEITFPLDLIQFYLSNFDIILVINWLHTYGAKIDCEELKVILKDEKGREVFLYGQREEKSYPLISAMKASQLICQGCIRYCVMLLTPKQKKRKRKILLLFVSLRMFFLRNY